MSSNAWHTFGWCSLSRKPNVFDIVLCLCPFPYQYLAPEVLRKQPYDNTVDWWCLGSVLYEMLYGLVSFILWGPQISQYIALIPAANLWCHCSVTLLTFLYLFFHFLAAVLQQGHASNVWQHPPQAAGDASWCVQHSLVSAPGPAGEGGHAQTGVHGWLCEFSTHLHSHTRFISSCWGSLWWTFAVNTSSLAFIQLTYYESNSCCCLRGFIFFYILHFQNEIKAHSFFSSINWDDLEQKKIPPPFTPNVVNICSFFCNNLSTKTEPDRHLCRSFSPQQNNHTSGEMFVLHLFHESWCGRCSLPLMFLQSSYCDISNFDPEFTEEMVPNSICWSKDHSVVNASVMEADDAFVGFSYAPASDDFFLWNIPKEVFGCLNQYNVFRLKGSIHTVD